MNIDLLTLQHTLAHKVGMAKTSPKPLLDALPDTLEAKVIALATVREATRQTFLLTLLLPGQHETMRITSDVAAPRESTVVLQRINGQWQLVPPSKELQRQALIQVQQASIPTQVPPLAETWQALQLWQQALQNQANLPSRAKKQLVLLRELLTSPAVNPVPNSGKEAHQNPQKIRQHINASGLFMEANFADKGRNITTIEDKKWLLIQLFGALQQSQQKSSTPLTSSDLLARPATKTLLTDSISLAVKTLPESASSHTMLTNKLTRSLPAMTWSNTAHLAQQPSVVTLATSTTRVAWQIVTNIPFEPRINVVDTSYQNPIDSIIKPTLTGLPQNALASSEQHVTNNPILPLLTKSIRTDAQVVNTSLTPSDGSSPPLPSFVLPKALVSHRFEVQWCPVTPAPATQPALSGVLSGVRPTNQSHTLTTYPKPWISLIWNEPSLLLDRPSHPISSPFKIAYNFTTTGISQDKSSVKLAPSSSLENVYLWVLLPTPLATSKARTETNVDKLIRQVFSGIMRIHSLQLESVSSTRDASSASPSSQHWHLDIPLLIGERWQSAQCHIYRQHDEEKHHKASHEKTRQQWGMRLRFELDNLGTLTVDAHLAGHQLNTTLWADTSALQTRVKKYREDLLARLREGGLHIDDIPCQLGNPPPLPKGKAFHQEVTT